MENCTDSSWKDSITELKNTTVTGFGVGIRTWTYQTCSQFGYCKCNGTLQITIFSTVRIIGITKPFSFLLLDQTCDPRTSCIFSHYMDLEHSLRICSEVYGLKPKGVMRSANFTNSYYGSDHPKGTRIVFVNGK